MVMVLKPLHDLFKIKRVVVSTYQSTSGAGRQQMDELFEQTKDIFANKQIKKKFFTKQIAFNVIPHIDSFLEDGQTKEEWKMQVETQKILDKKIQVSSTCVRVPVFIGHGESVNIEFEKEISEDKLREALKKSPGVSVIDYRKDEGYVTPEECAGEDKVFVSRIRKDNTLKNGISLWITADNLRKGAALNAIQIGEELIKKKVLGK
jgi:aspartate-semialdehyde dehydrogenase